MIRKIWLILKNLDTAYDLLRRYLRDKSINERRLLALDEYGIKYRADPTVYLGMAFELAEQYGLRIRNGTSYGSVRVELPPDLFPEGVKYNCMFRVPDVNSAWVDRSTLQAAVCDCLIMCLQEGLITP